MDNGSSLVAANNSNSPIVNITTAVSEFHSQTGNGPSERNPIRTKAFFDLTERKISFWRTFWRDITFFLARLLIVHYLCNVIYYVSAFKSTVTVIRRNCTTILLSVLLMRLNLCVLFDTVCILTNEFSSLCPWRHAVSGGAENAGVENAGAITYGKPSEEKTRRYQ